jgi:hypothetical protein
MTDKFEQIPELITKMQLRGFLYKGRDRDDTVKFCGPLHTSCGDFESEILVDSKFFNIPKIILTPVPNCLKPIAPHLSSDGELCYIAPGTVVLDIFHPVGQTLLCIQRAEHVLENSKT